MRRYLSFLFLGITLLVSEGHALVWQQNADGVYVASYDDDNDPSLVPVHYRYGSEAHPMTVLKMPSIHVGTTGRVVIDLNQDWRQARGYLSLREEVKEWLRRLGVVAENGNNLTFTKNLSIVYVLHETPSRQYLSGFGHILFCDGVWHYDGLQEGVAAVKLKSLPEPYGRGGSGNIEFKEKMDQCGVDAPYRSCSLPNDFFLRNFPYTEENSIWYNTHCENIFQRGCFAFVSFVILPGGETRVAIEEVHGTDSIYPPDANEVETSPGFIVTDECLEFIYNYWRSPRRANDILFRMDVNRKLADLMMRNMMSHIADMKALIAHGVDFNAAIGELFK
ncbi:MAG: hypothetical protein LBG98_02960 [Puniceicoccales bacterium]|jgi:hypothetical protein|nr:hypothetical protein [Puniceicoccales bacterium]